MKEIRYIITEKNSRGSSRNYLMVWDGNGTIEDPYGRTWTSFETFRKCQEQISVNPGLGIPTTFNSKEDAENFIRDFHISNAKVIQILFDTTITEQNTVIARDTGFCQPGISEEVMRVLKGW